jgi:hypothetical protein
MAVPIFTYNSNELANVSYDYQTKVLTFDTKDPDATWNVLMLNTTAKGTLINLFTKTVTTPKTGQSATLTFTPTDGSQYYLTLGTSTAASSGAWPDWSRYGINAYVTNAPPVTSGESPNPDLSYVNNYSDINKSPRVIPNVSQYAPSLNDVVRSFDDIDIVYTTNSGTARWQNPISTLIKNELAGWFNGAQGRDDVISSYVNLSPIKHKSDYYDELALEQDDEQDGQIVVIMDKVKNGIHGFGAVDFDALQGRIIRSLANAFAQSRSGSNAGTYAQSSTEELRAPVYITNENLAQAQYGEFTGWMLPIIVKGLTFDWAYGKITIDFTWTNSLISISSKVINFSFNTSTTGQGLSLVTAGQPIKPEALVFSNFASQLPANALGYSVSELNNSGTIVKRTNFGNLLAPANGYYWASGVVTTATGGDITKTSEQVLYDPLAPVNNIGHASGLPKRLPQKTAFVFDTVTSMFREMAGSAWLSSDGRIITLHNSAASLGGFTEPFVFHLLKQTPTSTTLRTSTVSPQVATMSWDTYAQQDYFGVAWLTQGDKFLSYITTLPTNIGATPRWAALNNPYSSLFNSETATGNNLKVTYLTAKNQAEGAAQDDVYVTGATVTNSSASTIAGYIQVTPYNPTIMFMSDTAATNIPSAATGSPFIQFSLASGQSFNVMLNPQGVASDNNLAVINIFGGNTTSSDLYKTFMLSGTLDADLQTSLQGYGSSVTYSKPVQTTSTTYLPSSLVYRGVLDI